MSNVYSYHEGHLIQELNITLYVLRFYSKTFLYYSTVKLVLFFAEMYINSFIHLDGYDKVRKFDTMHYHLSKHVRCICFVTPKIV